MPRSTLAGTTRRGPEHGDAPGRTRGAAVWRRPSKAGRDSNPKRRRPHAGTWGRGAEAVEGRAGFEPQTATPPRWSAGTWSGGRRRQGGIRTPNGDAPGRTRGVERREGDSNPRGVSPYPLSRRAHSAGLCDPSNGPGSVAGTEMGPVSDRAAGAGLSRSRSRLQRGGPGRCRTASAGDLPREGPPRWDRTRSATHGPASSS